MKSPTYVNLAAVLVAVTLLAVACSSEATSGSEAADAQTGVVVKPAETAAPESGAPVTRQTAPPSTEARDLEPVPIVDFVWFDGTAGSTADLVGEPTVLNFWASNCPPCLAEMPAFEEVHQALAESVAFVGIAVADPGEAARELAAQTGVTYRLGDDPDSAVFRSFGGFVMPTTVLLNSDGEVAYVAIGAISGDQLRILIDTHILPESP